MDSALLSRMIDAIDDGIFLLSPGGEITFRNRAFAAIFGDILDPFACGSFGFIDDAASYPATLAALREAIAMARPFDGDLIGYRASGERFWSRLSLTPECGADGSFSHFIGICRDVSALKTVESKASKLERDYRFIFDNVQSAITVHGADTGIRIANAAAVDLLGIEEEHLVGAEPRDPLWGLIRDDGSKLPLTEYPVIRAIAERKAIRGIVVGYQRPSDDKLLWFVCNAFPVRGDEDSVEEVLLSFTDITRLKKSETDLNILGERFELAARATQDVIFEWDIQTGEFWANDSFYNTYGYAPPPYIHLDTLGVTSGATADYDRVTEITLNAINSGDERYLVDYAIIRPDGTHGHIAVRAFITRDAKGTAQRIIGTGTDIGQLSQAINALEQSEIRFRLIADTASDVLWDHDFESNQTWSSPDWATKLGLEIGSETAQNFQWLETVELADRDKIRAGFDHAVRSGDSVWQIEFRAIRSDGQIIDLALKASILRNPAGRAVRMIGNMRNVTKEKRNQEGYTRARALEAVGQLTGGIAHDFNNLMMIILGNAEALELSDLDKESAEAVAMISQAAQSAGTLTQRLLTFARQAPLNTTRIDLPQLISDTLVLLRSGLPESIALSQLVAPGIWSPNVDPNGLEQALVNLAVNAKDAMPHGGLIVLSCSNLALSDAMTPAAADLSPGNYVVISVRDNGDGMPAAVRARAFEPFFTTKDIGKGTGLGLSTVYGFAKQSNGGVSISSEEGQGTTVSIYLPTGDTGTRHAGESSAARAPVPALGKKRILVVEDQSQVRLHVERTLRRFGYQVVTADSGSAAIEILRQGQQFDLLFTDIVMPGGLNGHDLAEAAVFLAPATKILYTSGYPAAAFEHLGLKEQGDVNMLQKPYKTSELEEAVLRTLAG